MPNGPVHRAATLGLAAVSAIPLVLYQPGWLVGVEAGILLTLWVNPDNDLHHRLGWLGSLTGFDLYKEIIPHRAGMRRKDWDWHDDPEKAWAVFLFSHIPAIATATRLALLAVPVWLVLGFLEWLQIYQLYLLLQIWIGASLSDALHVTMDYFSSEIKKFFKRHWYGQTKQARRRRKPRRDLDGNW